MTSPILIGSTTSPYVRRLRIYLKDVEFDFRPLFVFEEADRKELKKLSPVLKIPVMKLSDSQVIYDSRVIFNYFRKQLKQPELSLMDENLLTIIDGINDTLVILYSMQSSGIKIEEDKRFIKAQRERIVEGFDYLATHWAHDRSWDYPTISLYCLLDWASFRDLINIDEWPRLKQFWQSHQNSDQVKQTDPRV